MNDLFEVRKIKPSDEEQVRRLIRNEGMTGHDMVGAPTSFLFVTFNFKIMWELMMSKGASEMDSYVAVHKPSKQVAAMGV